jgi:hypothetical protein
LKEFPQKIDFSISILHSNAWPFPNNPLNNLIEPVNIY